MNITESNKLIAEFMGLVTEDANASSGRRIQYKKGAFVDYEACGEGFLKYDSSWGWLMPVVDKIGTLDDNDTVKLKVIEQFKHCSIFSPIKAVYWDCVDFITWYNTEVLKLKN